MAKELPYFKFEPSEYIAGNIQMCSMDAQGLFINLCSLYWIRLGYLPEKLAKQKLFISNASALQELYTEDIIKENEGLISISFLDEQLEEFKDTSEKRRNAANKRWKSKDAMQVHSKSNAIREEKKREDKRKVFTPPSLLDVKEYFKEKGYTEQSAVKAFDYYEAGKWKDSKGNKVKNWKQKMQGVWFKDENKIVESKSNNAYLFMS